MATDMNTCRPRARRIPWGLTLFWSFVNRAYSDPLTSNLSVQQRETTMSFIIWAVIGLTSGFVASQLEQRSRRRSVTAILLGFLGAMTGGYLYFTFGPTPVNGVNMVSYLAAACGALVFLLSLYVFRRL